MIHLVEPDTDARDDTYDWASDEAESMRFEKEGQRMKETQDMMELMRRKTTVISCQLHRREFPRVRVFTLFCIGGPLPVCPCRQRLSRVLAPRGAGVDARHFITTGEVDRIVYDHLFEL